MIRRNRALSRPPARRAGGAVTVGEAKRPENKACGPIWHTLKWLPHEAISEGDDIYVIDPNLCTEGVGFHDHEACQAVCTVECCVPDPNIRESEEVLLERAKKLHPDKVFPSSLPPELTLFANPNRQRVPGEA